MRFRPDSDPSPKQPAPAHGERRGELFWRSVRYGAAIFAGYLFGIAAGSAAEDGPPFYVLAGVGLLALWLVFRQGKKSQQHAAADAIATAISSARATAQNATNVNVAGGHIVQAGAAPQLAGQVTRYVQQVDAAGNVYFVAEHSVSTDAAAWDVSPTVEHPPALPPRPQT